MPDNLVNSFPCQLVLSSYIFINLNINKMKKKNYFALYALLMASTLVGCSKDDAENNPQPEQPGQTVLNGYYVLNSGKMGSNNSTITFYNTESKETTSDIFETANGRKLGDTANDMIIYGSKIYLAVYGSQTIEVTDLNGKSLKQIKSNTDKPLQPRAFTSYGGKVYVSLFDGYVASIDTTSLEIDNTVAVGRNPEQLTVANGKLYVANSGGLDYNTEVGYDKTVSVVNLESFTETKKIEAVLNPCNVQRDSQEDVYLVSMGNYADVPNTLQKINTSTDEISTVSVANATEMASLGDKIFMMYSQYDENWNQTITYYMYDAINENIITDSALKETIAKPYKIAADKASNMLFVTESDYTNNGDVYCFDGDGNLKVKFEAGLNPIKVIASSVQ